MSSACIKIRPAGCRALGPGATRPPPPRGPRPCYAMSLTVAAPSPRRRGRGGRRRRGPYVQRRMTRFTLLPSVVLAFQHVACSRRLISISAFQPPQTQVLADMLTSPLAKTECAEMLFLPERVRVAHLAQG